MKIYRFEKNEQCRIDSINKGEIWISKPEVFNDLNDCRLSEIYTQNYEKSHYQRIEDCINILYADEHYFPLPPTILDKLKSYFNNANPNETASPGRIRRVLDNNYIVNEIRNYLRSRTGVCCFFNGEPSHPLMWAHYADNHKGFCVEYDVDTEAEQLFDEVSYSNKLPSPTINELLFCPEATFLRILTTKSIEWSYEKEYRLIYLNAIDNGEKGKLINLPSGMRPVRIIKGHNFEESNQARELMRKIDIEKISYEKFKNDR